MSTLNCRDMSSPFIAESTSFTPSTSCWTSIFYTFLKVIFAKYEHDYSGKDGSEMSTLEHPLGTLL